MSPHAGIGHVTPGNVTPDDMQASSARNRDREVDHRHAGVRRARGQRIIRVGTPPVTNQHVAQQSTAISRTQKQHNGLSVHQGRVSPDPFRSPRPSVGRLGRLGIRRPRASLSRSSANFGGGAPILDRRADSRPTSLNIPNINVRTRQLAEVLRRAVSHPRWVTEQVILMRRRRELLGCNIPRANYERTTEEAAFATLFGTSAEDYAQLSAREWWPPSFDDTGGYLSCLDGSPELLRVIAAAVRLVKPDIMVETGVARGASSAVALAAMQENDRGHLHSIDLPPLAANSTKFIG